MAAGDGGGSGYGGSYGMGHHGSISGLNNSSDHGGAGEWAGLQNQLDWYNMARNGWGMDQEGHAVPFNYSPQYHGGIAPFGQSIPPDATGFSSVETGGMRWDPPQQAVTGPGSDSGPDYRIYDPRDRGSSRYGRGLDSRFVREVAPSRQSFADLGPRDAVAVADAPSPFMQMRAPFTRSMSPSQMAAMKRFKFG